VPRQLSTAEVARLTADFVAAAANAISAGFDGIELHGAGGYIFEQFLNPAVNDRSDQYGAASMTNRMRFLLETVDAVADRIGAHRVGIRFSPFGNLFDMPSYAEAEETYLALGRELARRKIAYMHLMDQSGFRLEDSILPANKQFPHLLAKLREAFHTGAIIVAGGLTRERANQLIADGIIDLAAFGEAYISNPDLVARFEHGWPLAPADRTSFYGGGAAGYIDYPAYGG
jgi:2,4-dienoyl-CoA reductase-like NADH-dependent reductase (Old Yellow Enzyme family)